MNVFNGSFMLKYFYVYMPSVCLKISLFLYYQCKILKRKLTIISLINIFLVQFSVSLYETNRLGSTSVGSPEAEFF